MTTEDKINILVVDDLPDKLLALVTVLETLGENVVTARSGREALRRLLEQDYAVILLDVKMPDMDGFETASLIRGRKKTEHTPIIFVTALSDEMHLHQGYSLGAVDYILSPVSPEVLRTKVGVFVDLYRMTEQVRRQAEERVALRASRRRGPRRRRRPGGCTSWRRPAPSSAARWTRRPSCAAWRSWPCRIWRTSPPPSSSNRTAPGARKRPAARKTPP